MTVADIRNFITYRLSRLQSRLNAQYIRVLGANCDLSLTEWRIVSFAALLSNSTLSDITRETGLDKGKLSRGATALIKKGYLASAVNKKDQRQSFLRLTAQGKALHAKIGPIMQQRQRDLVKGISAQDLDVTMRVVDALDRAISGTPHQG